eukprot:scaffold53140_cov64-Phaeocystis_antarctica.AAC.1
MLVYVEQPPLELSVAVPSRSLHPDSDRARIPSASLPSTSLAASPAASLAVAACKSRRCGAGSSKARGAGLSSSCGWEARSTGSHCGGQAAPRSGRRDDSGEAASAEHRCSSAWSASPSELGLGLGLGSALGLVRRSPRWPPSCVTLHSCAL